MFCKIPESHLNTSNCSIKWIGYNHLNLCSFFPFSFTLAFCYHSQRENNKAKRNHIASISSDCNLNVAVPSLSFTQNRPSWAQNKMLLEHQLPKRFEWQWLVNVAGEFCWWFLEIKTNSFTFNSTIVRYQRSKKGKPHLLKKIKRSQCLFSHTIWIS